MDKNHLFLIKVLGVAVIICLAIILIVKTASDYTGMVSIEGECVYGYFSDAGVAKQLKTTACDWSVDSGDPSGCTRTRQFPSAQGVGTVTLDLLKNTCKRTGAGGETSSDDLNSWINDLLSHNQAFEGGVGTNEAVLECYYSTIGTNWLIPSPHTVSSSHKLVYHYNGELDLDGAANVMEAILGRHNIFPGWVICVNIPLPGRVECEGEIFPDISNYINRLATEFERKFFWGGFYEEPERENPGGRMYPPNLWVGGEIYNFWIEMLEQNRDSLLNHFRRLGRMPNNYWDMTRWWRYYFNWRERMNFISHIAMRWASEKALANCRYL